MRHPLTRVELHVIRDRYRGDANVESLLWEIARLRARLLRVDQLQNSLTEVPPGARLILECLREELRAEPCIKESIGMKPDLISQFRVAK